MFISCLGLHVVWSGLGSRRAFSWQISRTQASQWPLVVSRPLRQGAKLVAGPSPAKDSEFSPAMEAGGTFAEQQSTPSNSQCLVAPLKESINSRGNTSNWSLHSLTFLIVVFLLQKFSPRLMRLLSVCGYDIFPLGSQWVVSKFAEGDCLYLANTSQSLFMDFRFTIIRIHGFWLWDTKAVNYFLWKHLWY